MPKQCQQVLKTKLVECKVFIFMDMDVHPTLKNLAVHSLALLQPEEDGCTSVAQNREAWKQGREDFAQQAVRQYMLIIIINDQSDLFSVVLVHACFHLSFGQVSNTTSYVMSYNMTHCTFSLVFNYFQNISASIHTKNINFVLNTFINPQMDNSIQPKIYSTIRIQMFVDDL